MCGRIREGFNISDISIRGQQPYTAVLFECNARSVNQLNSLQLYENKIHFNLLNDILKT